MLDKKKLGFKSGFSLMELLITIVLVSIIALMVVLSLGDKSAKARDAMRKENGAKVLSAIQMKGIDGFDTSVCQPETVEAKFVGLGVGGVGACALPLDGSDNAKAFLNKLGITGPMQDPLKDTKIPYVFSYQKNSNKAQFAALMELTGSLIMFDNLMPKAYADTHTAEELDMLKIWGTYGLTDGITNIIPVSETADIYDVMAQSGQTNNEKLVAINTVTDTWDLGTLSVIPSSFSCQGSIPVNAIDNSNASPSSNTVSWTKGTPGVCTFECTGGYTGNDCSTAPLVAVNGACGSANLSTVASAPVSNLCSAGTESIVSGTGPWSWTCAGTNGGTTDSCTASKTVSYTAESCFTFISGTKTITNYSLGCSKDVVIPPTIGGIDVLNIGNVAFKNKGLTSVIIPNSVIIIGDEAFKQNNLISVIIGNSVTTIGGYAFYINKLTKITIPNSVKNIWFAAFNRNGPWNDSNDITEGSTMWTSGNGGTWNLFGQDWTKQ